MARVHLRSAETTQATTVREHYDAVTIGFHWLTAALVLVLAGTAFGWEYLPRDWHFKQYESLHVSLGIGLAAVLIGRLIWRGVAGRRLGAVGSRRSAALSRLVHGLLYGLLALQVGLGFSLRWLQGEAFSFFGLFNVPALFAANRGWSEQVEHLHSLTAWALVILAGGHALAALYHGYVLKDGLLRRMSPVA